MYHLHRWQSQYKHTKMNYNTPSQDLFTIGAVAKSFGVSENTIRRMESAGLLDPALIKESGYRYYDYDNITRIKTILTLRSFGLVYDDMKQYFLHPGDFTTVYDKLYEKKLAIDSLLERARLHIKPENPGEVFLIPHNDFYVFFKIFEVPRLNKIEIIEDISTIMFNEAIAKKYPVDYARPLTIESDCTDFTHYDVRARQTIKAMVPLRYEVDSPDVCVLPSREIVSSAFIPGLSPGSIFSRIREYMADHDLVQNGCLAGTFEIGRHMDKNISRENYLFHIIIPCKKK